MRDSQKPQSGTRTDTWCLLVALWISADPTYEDGLILLLTQLDGPLDDGLDLQPVRLVVTVTQPRIESSPLQPIFLYQQICSTCSAGSFPAVGSQHRASYAYQCRFHCSSAPALIFPYFQSSLPKHDPFLFEKSRFLGLCRELRESAKMAEADAKPQNETVWFFIPLGFGFVDRISAKLGFDGGKQRFYRLDLYILMISMFDWILDSSLLLSLVKISVFHLSSSPIAGFPIDQILLFLPPT